jgi:hypothetical protein
MLGTSLRSTPDSTGAARFCLLVAFAAMSACSDGGSASNSDGSAGLSGSSTGGGAGSGGASGAAGGGRGGSANTGGGTAPTLADCGVFPADNAWNRDVSSLPVHANSDAFINSIGRDGHLHPDFGTEWEGAPIGIPYVLVDATTPAVPIRYTAYGDESDPGPFPIPPGAPIEGGPDGDGDRHVLVIDTSDCKLYELYRAFPVNGGASWDADSGVVWDLNVNDTHPAGCTSADAAGLPIFPGLARYDEIVERGAVEHALRFTVSSSQRAYVAPASHYASSNTDPNLPPMGLRLRMKATYDCSAYSNEVRVLCTALKKYGMIVADNGSNWYVSGAPDPRFSDDNLGDLKDIPGDAFEVVDTGDAFVTNAPDCSL